MPTRSLVPVVLLVWSSGAAFGCDGETDGTNALVSPGDDGGATSSPDAYPPWSTPEGDGGSEDRMSDATPTGGEDAASVLDAGADASAPSGVSCATTMDHPPADEMRMLEHDGMMRTFYVHVPASYDGRPTPLVLDFHGYLSNARQEANFSNMIEKSDEAGFVVVHAEGTGNPQRWNAGHCCPDGNSNVDDVGFVMAMIDELSRDLCIDPKRIYSTGLSNGGMLSYRLACQHADRIAAIAPVAASLVYFECAPTRGVPVLQFHGTRDNINPYRNADDSVAFWTTALGCADGPVETFSSGDTTCETWQSCRDDAEVTFCTVDGGGHTWPGGDVPIFLGSTTQAIDATDAIWEFFASHPLP